MPTYRSSILHYVNEEKTKVCCCDRPRHNHCVRVRNYDIRLWCHSFFRDHPDEYTCDQEQWRRYWPSPLQHAQHPNRRGSVPDNHNGFNGHSRRPTVRISSHGIRVGDDRPSYYDRPSYHDPPSSHDRPITHDGAMQEVFGPQGIFGSQGMFGPQGIFGSQGMFGSSPNPVNRPAPRPAPVSQLGTSVLSGAIQSAPKISASRPSQDAPPVDGDEDAVSACLLRVLEVLPDVPPEIITAMMDDATLCRKGVKSYSEEIINQLVELRSDLAVGNTPHSNSGNLGRSTGPQQVPIVDWEMPPPPYQDHWREDYAGPGNHIPGPSQQRPPLQDQWRGGPAGPGFHIPGPPQQQPPYRDHWLGGPTGPHNPIPGPYQQYPPYQDQWGGSATGPRNRNPGPVQQGRLPPYELSGESSGRAEYPVASTPPNNGPQYLPRRSPPTQPVRPWHNPYAEPPYQASGMAPQSRAPHEAVASANFSGARSDFLSEVLERGLVIAGPPDYAQRGYPPLRHHTPSPPARTQSPYFPGAYVGRPIPFPPPQNGRQVSFGHPPNAAFGTRNPYAGHEQYSRSGRAENQPSRYVPQYDEGIDQPIRRRKSVSFWDERPTASTPEYSPSPRPSTRRSEGQPSIPISQREEDVGPPFRRRNTAPLYNERDSFPPRGNHRGSFGQPHDVAFGSRDHPYSHDERYEHERYGQSKSSPSHQPSGRFVERDDILGPPLRRRNTAPLYNERSSEPATMPQPRPHSSMPVNIEGGYSYVDADDVRDRLSRADRAVSQHEPRRPHNGRDGDGDFGSEHGDRGSRTWRNV